MIDVTITNLLPMDHAILGWEYDSSSLFGPDALSHDYIDLSPGSVLAAGVHTYSFSFTNFFTLPLNGYSILGDYGGSTGATLGFSVASTSTYFGNPWPFTNPDEDHYIPSFAINNADQWDLTMRHLHDAGAMPVVGDPTTLINFSNGTLGGSAQLNVTPTPEPSTMLALGGGLVLLLKKRAKRLI